MRLLFQVTEYWCSSFYFHCCVFRHCTLMNCFVVIILFFLGCFVNINLINTLSKCTIKPLLEKCYSCTEAGCGHLGFEWSLSLLERCILWSPGQLWAESHLPKVAIRHSHCPSPTGIHLHYVEEGQILRQLSCLSQHFTRIYCIHWWVTR